MKSHTNLFGEVAHYNEGTLFMNSAGSSLMSENTVSAVKDYLDLEVKYGGYEVMIEHASRYISCYTEGAKLLNCRPDQIALCESATSGFNNAISSIPFKPNDVILTSAMDYGSNMMLYKYLEMRYKVKLVLCKTDLNGQIDLEDFTAYVVDNRPKLVAITHIPTNAGSIQDLSLISQLCLHHDIRLAIDACQSVGQINVDVQAIKCDILTVTGRKFLRAPRGTGLLYVSDKMTQEDYHPIMLDGVGAVWSDIQTFDLAKTAKRYEPFEHSLASFAGMANALSELNAIGIDRIEFYNKELAAYTRSQLSSLPEVVCYDLGDNLSSIISVRSPKWELALVQKLLKSHQIRAGITYRNMAYIDMSTKQLDWALRLSPHYFNSKKEVDLLVEYINSLNKKN